MIEFKMVKRWDIRSMIIKRKVIVKLGVNKIYFSQACNFIDLLNNNTF